MTSTAERHSLYRFFDDAGQLLYVGITKTLAVRWRNHSQKEWWPAVASATIEHFQDRESAETAELKAIREELPIWNVQHSTTQVRIVAPLVHAPHGGIPEMTPSQVAKVLKVSPATVRRWEEGGTLVPSRRLPGSGHRRYSRDAVMEFQQLLYVTPSAN